MYPCTQFLVLQTTLNVYFTIKLHSHFLTFSGADLLGEGGLWGNSHLRLELFCAADVLIYLSDIELAVSLTKTVSSGLRSLDRLQ